jgi:outer membrane receptor protein involved in Fe transport
VRGSLDVANLFNASSVLAENAGYGSQWLVPYETLGGRLFRVNAQVEF